MMNSKVWLALITGWLLSGTGVSLAVDNLVQPPGRSVVEQAQNSFIFVFDTGAVDSEEVPGMARGLGKKFGGAISHVYKKGIRGFAATMSDTAAARLASETPSIKYYERDGVMWAIGRPEVLPAKKPEGSPGKGPNKEDPEPEPTDPPPSSQDTPYGVSMVGGPIDGTGLHAWIIDSGIDVDHPDLDVDTSNSGNFLTSGSDTIDDQNGHGTHVAGTVAALDNDFGVVGVAAGATVHSVRVLGANGSGSVSGVVDGVEYVLENASPGDCANLSLGGSGHWESLHDMIVAAADAGIIFTIAAGNSANDAENYEPAHIDHPNVYTISAVDSDGDFAYFSNYGDPVDYAAPGVNVLSTYKGGVTETLSGTSMAAPHACGVILATGNSPQSSGTANNDPDGDADPIIHITGP